MYRLDWRSRGAVLGARREEALRRGRRGRVRRPRTLDVQSVCRSTRCRPGARHFKFAPLQGNLWNREWESNPKLQGRGPYSMRNRHGSSDRAPPARSTHQGGAFKHEACDTVDAFLGLRLGPGGRTESTPHAELHRVQSYKRPTPD